MTAYICFSVAAAVFLTFVILGLSRYFGHKKKNNIFKPVHLLMLGVFLASTIMFIPVYMDFFGQNFLSARAVILSVHNSIRLFAVDADFELVANFDGGITGAFESVYETFFAVLYCFAPILTAGFLVSLFKNFSSFLTLIRRYFRDIYVFSDLNERSIALAKDIYARDKKATVVFADVALEKDDTNELTEVAETIGAILFTCSISAINYSFHSKKKKLVFFVMDDNEEENVSTSWELFLKYGNRENTELYLFSMTRQSELFLGSIDKKHKMKIRRITESTAIINKYLYDKGRVIFDTATAREKVANAPKEYKVISAIVVGMGAYGMQMAKTLPWFCQMNDYIFKMNVFDADKNAESKFRASCPAFMDEKCNGVYVDGEAYYDIKIHSDFDYKTTEFADELKSIRDASFVFIALGSDEVNISCAITMRTYFERMGIHPHIVAVVYDKNKAEMIKGAKTIDNREYDVEYTGSLKEVYSVDTVINSELNERALAVHMQYPAKNLTAEEHKETFYVNEYNYNSSCASAIHFKVREELKMYGAGKSEKDCTEEEKAITSVVEHRRWNAYVRSCGYIYSGSPEKSSRNDLAKEHNCLIPYDELTEEYTERDTVI